MLKGGDRRVGWHHEETGRRFQVSGASLKPPNGWAGPMEAALSMHARVMEWICEQLCGDDVVVVGSGFEGHAWMDVEVITCSGNSQALPIHTRIREKLLNHDS
jgi:hypothetical protein